MLLIEHNKIHKEIKCLYNAAMAGSGGGDGDGSYIFD